MQILYLAIGLIGLTMTFYGAKWLLRSRTIISFQKAEREKEFNIAIPGLYSVGIIGGGHFKKSGNDEFQISNIKNQQLIELKESYLKWRFRKNWKMFVEYRQFEIDDIGNYKIEIQNHKGQSNQPMRNNQIIITESVKMLKRFLGIIFLVLGVNISFWGIILTINPTPFG